MQRESVFRPRGVLKIVAFENLLDGRFRGELDEISARTRSSIRIKHEFGFFRVE
jgi:hypothetical protein